MEWEQLPLDWAPITIYQDTAVAVQRTLVLTSRLPNELYPEGLYVCNERLLSAEGDEEIRYINHGLVESLKINRMLNGSSEVSGYVNPAGEVMVNTNKKGELSHFAVYGYGGNLKMLIQSRYVGDKEQGNQYILRCEEVDKIGGMKAEGLGLRSGLSTDLVRRVEKADGRELYEVREGGKGKRSDEKMSLSWEGSDAVDEMQCDRMVEGDELVLSWWLEGGKAERWALISEYRVPLHIDAQLLEAQLSYLTEYPRGEQDEQDKDGADFVTLSLREKLKLSRQIVESLALKFGEEE